MHKEHMHCSKDSNNLGKAQVGHCPWWGEGLYLCKLVEPVLRQRAAPGAHVSTGQENSRITLFKHHP